MVLSSQHKLFSSGIFICSRIMLHSISIDISLEIVFSWLEAPNEGLQLVINFCHIFFFSEFLIELAAIRACGVGRKINKYLHSCFALALLAKIILNQSILRIHTTFDVKINECIYIVSQSRHDIKFSDKN